MSDAPVEVYARLSHDVGKYVARIAHNVGDGPIPAALAPLMARDLYQLPGGRPASQLFAEQTAGLPDAPELTEARAHLAAIDAIESGVRAGEEDALREAAAHALAVESLLRALAARIGGESP